MSMADKKAISQATPLRSSGGTSVAGKGSGPILASRMPMAGQPPAPAVKGSTVGGTLVGKPNQGKVSLSKLDPKLAYFKDNIADEEDNFDSSQYIYQRKEVQSLEQPTAPPGKTLLSNPHSHATAAAAAAAAGGSGSSLFAAVSGPGPRLSPADFPPPGAAVMSFPGNASGPLGSQRAGLAAAVTSGGGPIPSGGVPQAQSQQAMMRSSGSTPIQPGMNPLRVSGGTVGGAAAATTGRAGQAIAGGYLSRNVTSAPGASSPAAAAAMPMPAQPPHAPPPTVAAAGQHGRTGAGGGRERSVSGGSSSAPRPSAAPGQPRAGPGTGIEEEGTGEFAMQDQDFPALLSHAQAAAGEAQRAAEYGLQGLVRVIRMLEPDLNILTLGTDLTTLGLNLNSPEALHPSFTSPWTDAQQPARVASGVATGGPSEYALPPCYLVQAPMQPASLKIHLFSDDTLFYIFYSHPRDYLQMLAAHELYKRDWRYHREMQRWLMRAPGTEPTFKSQTHEKGIYVFWDPDRAEKVRKELVVFYDLLETREPH